MRSLFKHNLIDFIALDRYLPDFLASSKKQVDALPSIVEIAVVDTEVAKQNAIVSFHSHLTVPKYQIVIILCDDALRTLRQEHLSSVEANDQTSLTTGFGLEGTLGIRSDAVSILKSDDYHNVGYSCYVLVEVGFVEGVEPEHQSSASNSPPILAL